MRVVTQVIDGKQQNSLAGDNKNIKDINTDATVYRETLLTESDES